MGRAPLSCARFWLCAPPGSLGLTHPSGCALRLCARTGARSPRQETGCGVVLRLWGSSDSPLGCCGSPSHERHAKRHPESPTVLVVGLALAHAQHRQLGGATHPPGCVASLRAVPPNYRSSDAPSGSWGSPAQRGTQGDAPFGLCGWRLWLCGAERRVVVCTLVDARYNLSHPSGCASFFWCKRRA